MLESAGTKNDLQGLDGKRPTNNAVASDKQLDTAEAALSFVTEIVCLSNGKDTCLPQISSAAPPTGCDADWYSAAPTCAKSECKTFVQSELNRTGCCYASIARLQEKADPNFEEFPNYNGIVSACNLKMVEPCPKFSGEPAPVEVQVSGSCPWINSDPSNIVTLQKELAKSLGLGGDAISGFKVTGGDGKSCSDSAKRHRMRGQQGGDTLKANFKVQARDTATASRIAKSAQAKAATGGIKIPAVEKQASKTAAVASNQKVAAAGGVPTPRPTPKPTSADDLLKRLPSGATLSFGTALAVVICAFAAVLF